MARIPKRLAGPAVGTGSAVTVYTVPSGTKTQVMQIHFSNGGSSPGSGMVSIGTFGSGTQIVPLNSPLLAPGEVRDYDGPIGYVMEAGEILQVSCGGSITCTVMGYENILGG